MSGHDPKDYGIPTPIDPADIRLEDVIRIMRDVAVFDIGLRAGGEAWINGIWMVRPGEAYLVSRPDPDAEAVEALRAACSVSGSRAQEGLGALREQGWDVVRRAES